MGLMEKRRFKNFLSWVNDYSKADAATYKGKLTSMLLWMKILIHKFLAIFMHLLSIGCPPEINMLDAFKKFGLDSNTQEFVGHAMCLYRDDK